MSVRFVVLPTPAELAEVAADRIVAATRNAIRRRGRCVMALSGGSTPRLVYPLLASPPRIGLVDWPRVELFWGDERAVASDHPDSNYGLARRLLLDHLPGIRPEAIHRMPADAPDRQTAADRYQAEIARVLGAGKDTPHPPRFDLIWLGMGPDGHTASLFPGSAELDERRRWVVPATAPSTAPVRGRMSFTLPLINAARSVLFVVAGGDKAPAVQSVRDGSRALPAARVRAASTLWLLDAAAATRIAPG